MTTFALKAGKGVFQFSSATVDLGWLNVATGLFFFLYQRISVTYEFGLDAVSTASLANALPILPALLILIGGWILADRMRGGERPLPLDTLSLGLTLTLLTFWVGNYPSTGVPFVWWVTTLGCTAECPTKAVYILLPTLLADWIIWTALVALALRIVTPRKQIPKAETPNTTRV